MPPRLSGIYDLATKEENALLRDVVARLWKTYKYHVDYHQYLLGGMDETTFLHQCEHVHADPFVILHRPNAIRAANHLCTLLGEDLTTMDLHVLLGIDPSLFTDAQTMTTEDL